MHSPSGDEKDQDDFDQSPTHKVVHDFSKNDSEIINLKAPNLQQLLSRIEISPISPELLRSISTVNQEAMTAMRSHQISP